MTRYLLSNDIFIVSTTKPINQSGSSIITDIKRSVAYVTQHVHHPCHTGYLNVHEDSKTSKSPDNCTGFKWSIYGGGRFREIQYLYG